MAVARAKGKLRGRRPKLSPKQQAELCRMYASGDYSIANLTELFTVSRPTISARFSASTSATLASCTDDHAHQCRLMLGIKDTLSA
jgi:hypothetical protein